MRNAAILSVLDTSKGSTMRSESRGPRGSSEDARVDFAISLAFVFATPLNSTAPSSLCHQKPIASGKSHVSRAMNATCTSLAFSVDAFDDQCTTTYSTCTVFRCSTPMQCYVSVYIVMARAMFFANARTLPFQSFPVLTLGSR